MLNPTDLILVCLIPEPRDLEIARLLGWYRIPFRSAPKIVAVDALAFYQPASFGNSGGRIEFLAPVLGHELTTRRELIRDEPDHPRSNEEYYKIQLGPLERLTPSIMADKWKRLTFLYTTGEYLSEARTLNDLVVKSEERQVLWNSLRERAQGAQAYRAEPLPDLIPEDVLITLLGFTDITGLHQVKDISNEDLD